jgi:hypothetical protein
MLTAMTRDQLFDALSALSATQLNAVLYKLAVPRAILPGPSTPAVTVIVEALHWAEQQGRLDDVVRLLDEVSAPASAAFAPDASPASPLRHAVNDLDALLLEHRRAVHRPPDVVKQAKDRIADADPATAASIVHARRWLVVASLCISGAFLVFCALAPALGFPGLDGGDALRLLEITLPVFLGYLGSAVQFVFGGEARLVRVVDPVMLMLLVRGPVVIFGLTVAISLAAYGVSHRNAAPVGTGLSIEVLAGLVAASMGLLAATTNVIVGYLFGVHGDKRRSRRPPGSSTA